MLSSTKRPAFSGASGDLKYPDGAGQLGFFSGDHPSDEPPQLSHRAPGLPPSGGQ